MKTPLWWAVTQLSQHFKVMELQKKAQRMMVLSSFSMLAAQHGPEEAQDQVQRGWDLTRSFVLRSALFSMNFNTSLAIQTQLKTHLRTKRGNGPFCSAPTASLLSFHPGGRSHLRTALQKHRPQNKPPSGKPQCCSPVSQKCWLPKKEITTGFGPKWVANKTVVHAKVVKTKERASRLPYKLCSQ